MRISGYVILKIKNRNVFNFEINPENKKSGLSFGYYFE